MLPKEEKITKKKSSDVEQPGLFDKVDEKTRLAKKRRFIYIAMFLTVGLSLSFWIYRSLKNFKPSFKLPSLSFTVPAPPSSSIKTTVNLSLPQDSSTWSIFVKRLDSDSVVYQKNQDVIFSDLDLNNLLTKIDKTNFIKSSDYTSSLPQGLKIKELITEDSKSFSYFSKITTPSQEMLLVIKITDSKDLNQAKKFVPDLVDQLYWYSLQK